MYPSADLTRIRTMFLFFAVVLFGGLGLLGVLVWFTLPEITGFAARTQAELTYRLAYAKPLQVNGAFSATSTTARSVPVLLYHGEGPNSDMPLQNFVDQLRTLKESGWRTITLQAFEDFVAGKSTVPDKSFLLTFDDGRKDTYYGADPVLKDLGFTAVMYVITQFSLPDNGVKSNYYLSPTELRHMVESGRWELESHGDRDHGVYAVQSTTDPSLPADTVDGHFLANKFWVESEHRFETDDEFAQRIRGDLMRSKSKLEEAFGKTVTTFAYPFNDYGNGSINYPHAEEVVDTEVSFVYTLAFYQTWGENGDSFNYPLVGNGPHGESYMIKRIEPLGSWSPNDLLLALEHGRAKELPYEPTLFSSDWKRVWGKVETGASLILSATASTTGASAFLDGTRSWQNYRFMTTFEASEGTSLSLIARNADNTHNVECAFSPQYLDLEVNTETGQRSIAHASLPQGHGTTVGIEVRGGRVYCYRGSQIVLSSLLPPGTPPTGGIGVQVWNKTVGAATATISSLVVK